MRNDEICDVNEFVGEGGRERGGGLCQRKFKSNIVSQVLIVCYCFLEYTVFLKACDTIRGMCRSETARGSPDHSVPNFSSLSTVQFAKAN